MVLDRWAQQGDGNLRTSRNVRQTVGSAHASKISMSSAGQDTRTSRPRRNKALSAPRGVRLDVDLPVSTCRGGLLHVSGLRQDPALERADQGLRLTPLGIGEKIEIRGWRSQGQRRDQAAGPEVVLHEGAGVGGLLIEDQDRDRKQQRAEKAAAVVDEAVIEAKLRTALAVRRDHDTFIVGRTDAYGPLGLDAAMRRAERFLALGVDGVFVAGLRTEEGYRRVGAAFRGAFLSAAIFEAGNTPWLTPADLGSMGFTQIRPVFVKAGRTLALRPFEMAWRILLPAAMPEIFSGLRIGFALTLIGVILGEMFASQRGVGFLLMNAIGLHNVDLIMALTFMLTLFAAAASVALLSINKRLQHGP